MSKLARFVPLSLQGYQRSWLSRDIVAGVTLAAVAIPERQTRTPELPGLLVFRFDARLFFANASRFSDEVLGLVSASTDEGAVARPRLLITR